MRPPQGSRTPVVLDALVALFTAAAAEGEPLAGVQVLDGPRIAEDIADDVLLIAPSEDPSDEAVVVNRVPQPGLGKNVYVEQTHVTMALSCFTGDTDMAARRARLTEIFNAIAAIVRAEKVRDGAWGNLYLGEQEAWYQVQAGAGAVAAVGFTIVSEAIV